MSLQSNIQPELPIYRYQFQFSVEQALKLPDYPGSAWRGAFGHALKRTVCIVRNTACSECLLKNSCAYSYTFETQPPQNSSKMRKYNAIPHPFIFQFTNELAQPLTYQFNMHLFGKGQRFFPYIIHALQKAGLEGIGGGRQVFTLETIHQKIVGQSKKLIYQHGQLEQELAYSQEIVPAMPEQVELLFHSPVRIKQNGHNLNADSFNFAAFFGNLLRRISMLTYFHTEHPLETDFAALTQQAKKHDFYQSQLQWFDWKRFSSRQQTEMNMGGVIGSVKLDLQGMEAFWPYLWLGQLTHVGKATSMGMGHYTIQSASLPESL